VSELVKTVEVPTGEILIVRGELGLLETVSVQDYGAPVNVNPATDIVPAGVPLMPREEKWVVTISSQYGCRESCQFCDVPKVGAGLNATYDDMMAQIDAALSLHPEVTSTKRLNLHFARMGEPTWNPEVIWVAMDLEDYASRRFASVHSHPVVSTMCPKKNPALQRFVRNWVTLKNSDLQGEAGLQLSINSTDEETRRRIFSGQALTLAEIADMMAGLHPVGRKFTLNFCTNPDWPIDPAVLLRYFDPSDYIVKLTNLHPNRATKANQFTTARDNRFVGTHNQDAEALRAAGYDVLVFVSSADEDAGRITCGNAILADGETTSESP
jgi:23S rRNA (adenine2503-C2)-methyltransferase